MWDEIGNELLRHARLAASGDHGKESKQAANEFVFIESSCPKSEKSGQRTVENFFRL